MILDALVAAAITLPDPDRHHSPSRAAVSRIVEAASLPPAGWGAFAACVEERESHGNPRALNASGHAGLVQWSRDWSRGLPYVVARGLVAHGMPRGYARTIRLSLPHRIEAWPAVLQRVAFSRVLVEGGRSAAMRHWSLAGSRCNGLVP